MKILVTGAAGFIGYHTCLRLINQGHEVYGIDNINDYYDPKLKTSRLNQLGLDPNDSLEFGSVVKSKKYENLKFTRLDITKSKPTNNIFRNEKFEVVCNLAAQAGVRYSIKNPKAYVDTNIIGFYNILEACRNYNIKHLVYASSSSVYGENKKVPFNVSDSVDNPVSLYAATKKSNELMAHSYGHLYNFKTTGLRFFTVYGPWGRPDMAYFLFVDAIINKKPIKVFNNGKMKRDFTYIDDIVEGVCKIIELDVENRYHYSLFNIGNNKTETLDDFIFSIERALNIPAIKKYLPMQLGDVSKTWADIDDLSKEINYQPKININEGIKKFVKWYKDYYKNKSYV